MKWYFIDKKYINFLKKFDYKVSNVDYGENKNERIYWCSLAKRK